MGFRLSNKPIRESRTGAFREPKSKLLFFVEGAKTEIVFLKGLQKHIDEEKNIQVEIFDRLKKLSGESNQLKIVEKTRDYLATCQGLGKRKMNLIKETIKKLEYNDFTINEIKQILSRLEKEIDQTILTTDDLLDAQLQSIKLCYEYDPAIDRICFILDRDFQSFQEFQYDSVIKICEEENFMLGVSSPNFEFFLLLHIEAEFPEISKEEIFQNKDNFSETMLKRVLRDIHGENYRKSNYNVDFFINKFDAFKQNVKYYEQNPLKLKTHIGSSLGLVLDELIN